MIRYPPHPEAKHNPFAKLPPYRYSQRAFKTFSTEEIRQQAGLESLPEASNGTDEGYGIDQLSLRTRGGPGIPPGTLGTSTSWQIRCRVVQMSLLGLLL